MTAGTTCPSCEKLVSFWSVFSALLPTRIRCGHCGLRIRYDVSWRAHAAILSAHAVSGCAAVVIGSHFGSLLIGLVAFIVLAEAIEVLATTLLRRYATLKPRGKGR